LALFTPALFPLMGALLAFPARPGLLIRRRDGINAGSDDSARRLGRTTDDRTGRPGLQKPQRLGPRAHHQCTTQERGPYLLPQQPCGPFAI
jgi:hypothetical protein